MKLDCFSPTRGHVAVQMLELGQIIVEPGTPEHQACKELVAFGRAFQLPGSAACFAPERRIDPNRS